MAAATQTLSLVEQVLADSNRTAEESAAASSSALSVVMSVRMVHGMMGEMLRGIGAVESHVSTSRQRIASAAVESNKALDTVSRLSHAVEAIASTATLIDRIAHATNMLALNPPIKAARAGDRGKGFAVVASEVRSLAQQTAQATEGVHQQLDTIREADQDVIAAVGVLSNNLNGIQTEVEAVSAAVTQYNSSLGTVAGFAHEAADTVEGIAATLDRIAEAARTTSQRVRQFNGSQTI